MTTLPTPGAIIAEGKTKIIRKAVDSPGLVIIHSKDDITAGNGAKHDILSGKGALATTTTCNVFTLLENRQIATSFLRQLNDTDFLAQPCTMLPYEVVVRAAAYGSYLNRCPGITKGTVFPLPFCEFYLKTNERKWKEYDLVADDPFMVVDYQRRQINLYDPSKPLEEGSFLTLMLDEVFTQPNELDLLVIMESRAIDAFGILRAAWKRVGGDLVDFKIEFGLTADGRLVIADVIDNDSWRVMYDEKHIDKQAYREGEELAKVLAKYKLAAELTGLPAFNP